MLDISENIHGGIQICRPLLKKNIFFLTEEADFTGSYWLFFGKLIVQNVFIGRHTTKAKES